MSWQKHALDFGMKAPTMENMVMRVIHTVQSVSYEHFVNVPTMTEICDKGCVFRSYPYANYATDVKFQPTNRPSGRFGEQKHYFSGKHKLYGLKIDASVSPEGLLVDMSSHEPGSVSDITMFRDRLNAHFAALQKSGNESLINDNGELFQDFPSSWAVLVDKGYCRLTSSARATQPKKRPTNGTLGRTDLDRNANISSDRVIVENVFGRVCLLWKISYATYVWGTKSYDAIQRLTFSLTNFHHALMPLRQDDQHQYRAVLARYRRMVEENNTNSPH
ncbi:hypothetical protein H310_14398 [Aphanomyces invadans]|uniref:DDE Tnp4 domain-containing protein n=1 Tax=Aphanomyces invadans TaxID=157072 RepID=A0A024T9W6_9STRA|nr:hypothetical protein H310_14398 [Aphanomyces invadans]ETV90910.1 hypothetical protein H310_14398 [Aphanomyces invadans]|eukprot:XP_008880475.1 hypothetical protein H310_14398 [Aphanomyces invadans]